MRILLSIMPRRILSRWVGRMMQAQLPLFMRSFVIKQFVRIYQINLQEAEHPLDHYQSIGELFIRKLKLGVRPLGTAELVHPADSRLTQSGPIDKAQLIQAKGLTYSVSEFLGFQEAAQIFEGGSFATYYLCPTDYHRVHAPVSGKIRRVIGLAGDLWPVNEWSTASVQNLFGINERVVIEILTEKGLVCVVLVGATNVGQMTLDFWPEFRTNLPQKRRVEKSFENLSIEKGQELGMFHMGSTVVLVLSKTAQPHDWDKRPQGQFVNVRASFFEARRS